GSSAATWQWRPRASSVAAPPDRSARPARQPSREPHLYPDWRMAPPFGVPRVRRCSAGSLPRLPGGLAGPAGLRYRFGSLQLDSSVRLPGFDHRRRSGDDGPPARFRFQLHETVTGAAVPGRLVLASGLRRLTIRRAPDGGYVVAAPPAAACTLLPDRPT